MNKTLKIVGIVLLVLFVVGAATVYFGWRYISGFLDEEPEKAMEMAEEYREEFMETGERTEEEPEGELEENPYYLADDATPMTERDIAMNENVKRVLGEVFEEEPKLANVGSGYWHLYYVTDRVITVEDVQEVRDVFTGDGFKVDEETMEVELSDSSTNETEYTLHFRVNVESDEIGYINMRMGLSITEEGERAQEIRVGADYR